MALNDYSCCPFPPPPHSLKHLNDPPVQRARLSVPPCIRANYLYLLLSEQSLPKEEFLADAGSLFLVRFHRGDSSEEFLFIVFELNFQTVCFLLKKKQIQITKELSLILEAIFPFYEKNCPKFGSLTHCELVGQQRDSQDCLETQKAQKTTPLKAILFHFVLKVLLILTELLFRKKKLWGC